MLNKSNQLFSKSTQTILRTKYNIYIQDYSEDVQKEVMEKTIERNTQIIDINQQKVTLLKEINNDISEFMNRGDKVASK